MKHLKRGVLLLTTLQLLAGFCSIFFLVAILQSDHSDFRIAGVFGFAFTGCLGTSGLALTLRKRWSWRVSVVAQCLAISCTAVVAAYGIIGTLFASGDFAYADATGGLIVLFFAILISVPCIIGLLLTLRKSVQSLFDH